MPIRGIWSDEANMECDQIMRSKVSALNITGKNAKVIAKEVFDSLYAMTKIDKGGSTLNAAITKSILDIPIDGYTRTQLMNMFANTTDSSKGNSTKIRKATFNTWDKMTIPANYFYEGQEAIKTTIGRFVVNRYILDGAGVIAKTGFIDEIWNKSMLGKMDDKVAELYMEDHIDRYNFNQYTERVNNLGYWMVGPLAHTISEKMSKPLPEIEKKKAELIKKYEKELAAGDIVVMTKISDELIAYAKELLKDDPGMDLYYSGDLDFANNYKNNAIIKGAVMNKLTHGFDFISTSFMDGIAIKDIPAHSNSILQSQFESSIATASAGYLGKKLIALLQLMQLDEPDSDCGSTHLIPLTITKVNKSNVLYTYIDDGNGGLTMLDNNNVDSYVGKTVKMRSPQTCKNDLLCSKCAGQLFYLLGIKHAGMFGVQISHADLNLALKAKHCSNIDLYTINPDEVIMDL